MRLTAGLMLSLATVACAEVTAEPNAAFIGVWEGPTQLVAIYGDRQRPSWLADDRPLLRIRVPKRGRAQVKLGEAFFPFPCCEIETQDAAASVHTIDSSAYEVESLQISLTITGVDTAWAVLWRVRTDKTRRADEPAARTAFAVVGELKRTASSRRDSR